MARVYNFSAGPSVLPETILQEAAKEMIEWGTSGMSVMEMSHRSKDYQSIIDETEANVRKVMAIPANYKVLFLQGGGSLQFAMVPLNLYGKNKKAAYINTGAWTKKAIKEAKKWGEVVVIGDSSDQNFKYIPKVKEIPNDIDFLYICYNNTIYGTRYTQIPSVPKEIPIVADMSSCIMSEPIDVSQYGVIFAGAQKNLGPAGVTLVIIREDLIKETPDHVPTMLSYKIHAEEGSMYNTPPTYGIYMLGKMMKWILNQGGVDALYQNNLEKAKILYDYLDSSNYFKGTVEKEDRSLMNVPFLAPTEELNAQFVKEATAAGFVNLKGHRSVGGMRASIYNAMPIDGVKKLVEFMATFAQKNPVA